MSDGRRGFERRKYTWLLIGLVDMRSTKFLFFTYTMLRSMNQLYKNEWFKYNYDCYNECFCFSPSHYTIVASTQIRPHSDFTVAVSLHDNPGPATIRLTIDNGQRYSQSKEAVVQPFSTIKVIFQTGPMPDATDSGYRLIAEGIAGLSFRNESQLQLNEKRFSVLVQTDKALYKPGDMIQFRVLVLDPSTKPFDIRGDMQVKVLVSTVVGR